jgi:hypothetical protein
MAASSAITNIVQCTSNLQETNAQSMTYQMNDIYINLKNVKAESIDLEINANNNAKIDIKNLAKSNFSNQASSQIQNVVDQIAKTVQDQSKTAVGDDSVPSTQSQKDLKSFMSTITTNCEKIDVNSILTNAVNQVFQGNTIRLDLSDAQAKKIKAKITAENVTEGIISNVSNAVLNNVFKDTVIDKIAQDGKTDQSTKSFALSFWGIIMLIIVAIILIVIIYFIVKYYKSRNPQNIQKKIQKAKQ